MKKVFFTMIVFVASLSSCSKSSTSDSNPVASSSKIVTFNIGGVAKTFSATVVKTSSSSVITVDATIGTAKGINEIEKIHFTASEQTLATYLLSFTYTKAGVEYNKDDVNFVSNCSSHSNGSLKGTFSGNVINSNSQTISLSGGSFDLSY